MDYRVDAKGKYYTTHVSKRNVPVIARVPGGVVHGMAYLTLDNRLKDELNTGETFLALTDVQVFDESAERLLYESDVLLVNKRHLIWIIPRESESDEGEEPA